jgi:hypothetical protein
MTAIIIWILAAVGLAQAILATRAYLLEKREGLPRSSLRFGASIGVALALVGLGVVVQLQHRGGAATTASAPTKVEHDKATQDRIDALRAKIGELAKELAKQQAELDQLDPQAAPATNEPPSEPPAWPLLAAIALVLAGFGVLTLGDLSTLLPRRTKPSEDKPAEATPSAPDEAKPEPADLPTLSAHVAAGRWKAGLACASRIQTEKLHKLEVLDVLFLRAYCAVSVVVAPEDGKAVGSKDKTERLAAAQKDLDALLELAPHMAEARWLVGYVKAHAGDWQAGLDTMRASRNDLDVNRAFEQDESVCLLMLAEAKLAAADNDGATKLFDEVTRIGALANQIPVAMVTHRFLTAREHIKTGKLAEAADGIARIRQVAGLDDKAQRATSVACDVYDVAIQFRSAEYQRALDATQVLFQRWLPAKLPDVEDQVADEFLLPAIDAKELPLPADLYRGLYFLEAVTRVELASRRGKLVADEVDAIATALLRALQFQPRHRESLAALAALYLAYRKERTEKALAWLDAALTMGVRSPRARNLLLEARRVEQERKELLAMFRAASSRFLADPAVEVAVREALIEELGRFDEFRPVVLDLQASGALDAAPASDVTVTALRERAAFVGGVASEVVRRADPAAVGKLAEIHRELTALANNVDTSATRIAALERAVMEQLGRIVLR